MSLSNPRVHGRGERGSIGPTDTVGLAGFVLALVASVAVWAVAILLLVLVLG